MSCADLTDMIRVTNMGIKARISVITRITMRTTCAAVPSIPLFLYLIFFAGPEGSVRNCTFCTFSINFLSSRYELSDCILKLKKVATLRNRKMMIPMTLAMP